MDNASLVLKFSEEEVWNTIKGLSGDSAPGLDGSLSCFFFKSCWGDIKLYFMEMVKDFYEENLDLKRLNYGVIFLIPKIKEANNISQF